MLGKILISSALIVSLMFVASQIENSKYTIKEAKDIQEHYEIIKEIKTLIAKRYNIDPENITRDDIIAHLPKGENWEKILLLDRQKDSNLSNKEFINSEANIVLNSDEKIKILALKAKLKGLMEQQEVNKNNNNGNFEFKVAADKKNLVSNDKIFNDSLSRAINYLSNEILYGDGSKTTNSVLSSFKTKLDDFINYESIYLEFLVEVDTSITDTKELENASKEALKKRKQEYFWEKLIERLSKFNNSVETRLYNELKDEKL